MADLSDVEQAIVNEVTSVFYPLGAVQSSVLGIQCRIFRGWPNSAALSADLGSGIVNVTVNSDNDSGRTTTRFMSPWQTSVALPGTTVSVNGSLITIGGLPALGDLVGVLISGRASTYRVEAGDTAAQVAGNLARAIALLRLVSTNGAVIRVYDSPTIIARVVCDGNASRESRRQEKDVRLICWCPNPSARDLVAASVDEALDRCPFLVLPNGSSARLVYRSTSSYDQAQNALLYRRDLVYCAEYPTVAVMQQPSMLFGTAVINNVFAVG